MRRVCPACGSGEKTRLYRQDFHNKAIALMENYDVVSCARCGFVYADNLPSQKEFDRYYARMSKYEFNFKRGEVSGDYLAHFEKIVKFLKPYLANKKISILDIGCSTGALLSVLKKEGYRNLLGLDPSAACARSAAKLYAVKAIAGSISGFKPKRRYGLIILSAVLEHLVDFAAVFKKIRLLLEDDGLLFIEVPDAPRFHKYIFTPFQQFSIEHVNYFSRASLINLLGRLSFKPLAMKKNENRVNQTVDPDIFALFKKTEKHNFKPSKDRVCQVSLKKYIAASSRLDARVKALIRRKLSGKGKVVVWGVGTHTQRLLGAGIDLSRVEFFVDSNRRYHGKKLGGLQIRPPEAIKAGMPILISTYSFQEEVIRQIRKDLKLKNEVIKIYE